MKNNLKVLFVDDNKEYGKLLKITAEEYDIDLECKTNLEEMINYLSINKFNIGGIILDIKCKKTPNSPEDESFIGAALTFLQANEELKYIPRVILTGDKNGYFKSVGKIFSDETLFHKDFQEFDKLFTCLKEKAEHLASLKLRDTYKDIFNIFEKDYLDIEIENHVFILLNNKDKNELTEIIKNLGLIRTIQEKILQTLNKKDKNVLPNNCFKLNKDLKFWDAHKHLSGNKTKDNNYKPKTISYYSGIIETFSETIYKVSSDNGAHSPYENPDYYPTKYTDQSLTFALMDLLKWFEARMDNITNS